MPFLAYQVSILIDKVTLLFDAFFLWNICYLKIHHFYKENIFYWIPLIYIRCKKLGEIVYFSLNFMVAYSTLRSVHKFVLIPLPEDLLKILEFWKAKFGATGKTQWGFCETDWSLNSHGLDHCFSLHHGPSLTVRKSTDLTRAGTGNSLAKCRLYKYFSLFSWTGISLLKKLSKISLNSGVL